MEKQVAILIDGDNIAPKYAEYIKQEAMRLGRIKICRLYGSIDSSSVKSWYKVMPLQGITPVLQMSYANGKSIADQALTIDAMDILYTGDVDVICLVSSDSDFTKLAYRMKEAGKTVIGMGEKKTNESLAKACDEFKLLDLIYKAVVTDVEVEPEPENKGTAPDKKKKESRKKKKIFGGEVVHPEPEREIEEEEIIGDEPVISIPTEDLIIEDIMDILDDDWELLAKVGAYINKRRPGFDVRIYGYRNMSDFIKKHKNSFEMKKVKAEDNIHENLYVRKVQND
ncbi:MAG: NYN domain-containing protein [Lachnospiraceae bacterium]|nr:NYN domain-containing protein [Lachnospiraceae bacterium]